MLSYAIVSLAMTSAALGVALPHGLVSSSASWCQGLGGGAFDTASNFTVAAYDISGSNANSTGAPLVLTETSTQGSDVYMAFATYATQPDNTFASFSLSQGILVPNPGNTGANITDLSVSSGDSPSFMASTDGDDSNIPSAAQVYCAVANTDPDGGDQCPILAVNNDTGMFSVCTSTSGDSSGQDIIVFEAAENSSDYDYNSCTPVHLHLLGLD
ncbi:hypothetical protein DAEQUDRAFT_767127 [Daedalea quercina L-15889]|uniref:Uncharacterized protein n=1 Tax=Daedalea quercina L-15889 TaxID=1314783 RepID=A0A165NZL6_9APHY|nr:hypothetical protein DAEQUDRAFT_767127 [Daedalea quercina L-15889]